MVTLAFTESPRDLLMFEVLHRGLILSTVAPDDVGTWVRLKQKFEAASDLCHCGKMITPSEPGRRLRAPAMLTLTADEARVYAGAVGSLLGVA